MAVFNKGFDDETPAYEVVNSKPQVRPSIVAFVDLLGYASKVNQAAKEACSTDFLANHRQSLLAASDRFDTGDPCYAFSFTDSMVIGWPIEEDAEVPLGMTCSHLAEYQLDVIRFGYFVRGGVSVGEAYFDDLVQSGEAFIKAYNAETHSAIYPRIVLTQEAMRELRSIITSFYADREDCVFGKLFCVDADGEIFINYLAQLFMMFDSDPVNGASAEDQRDIEDYLEDHKQIIEENLMRERGNPQVYRKYQWAARYHDFFCASISNLLSRDLSISVDYEKNRFSPPRLLLEAFPDWL